MKDGNNKKYQADGGIGLLSSRLTFQGPIQKEKSSFIISGRRTYIDLIAAPFVNAASNPGSSTDLILYFYDLNAKINHKISKKNRIFFSAYTGKIS